MQKDTWHCAEYVHHLSGLTPVFSFSFNLIRNAQMLEICLRLGVRCVSVYSFSIENFKRSPKEVEALMNLAEEKLLELCEHGCVFLKGVALQVLTARQRTPRTVRCPTKRLRKEGSTPGACASCRRQSGESDPF